MPRRRTKPYCPVLALRLPAALAAEIAAEARKRKIPRSSELKRRLAYYDAAHAKPAKSASTISA